MRWHKHEWRYFGGQRVEMGNKTFWITIDLCKECEEIRASATDMQPYLDLPTLHLGAGND